MSSSNETPRPVRGAVSTEMAVPRGMFGGTTGEGVQSSSREINWMLITPLAFAFLPLVHYGLRHKPALRSKVYFGFVGLGLVHGMVLIMGAGDASYKTPNREETFYSPHELNVRATPPPPPRRAAPAQATTPELK